MKEVVIVGAARIPFGKFGGLLRDYSAVDLATHAVKGVLQRTPVQPEVVDELFLGVAVLAGTASVAARQVLFTAGLPPTTPSLTVDRACCSSMTCAGLALRNILAGGNGGGAGKNRDPEEELVHDFRLDRSSLQNPLNRMGGQIYGGIVSQQAPEFSKGDPGGPDDDNFLHVFTPVTATGQREKIACGQHL